MTTPFLLPSRRAPPSEIDAVEQQGELVRVHLDAPGGGRGKMKRRALETLIPRSRMRTFPSHQGGLRGSLIRSIPTQGESSAAWASGIPATACVFCCKSMPRPCALFPHSGRIWPPLIRRSSWVTSGRCSVWRTWWNSPAWLSRWGDSVRGRRRMKCKVNCAADVRVNMPRHEAIGGVCADMPQESGCWLDNGLDVRHNYDY